MQLIDRDGEDLSPYLTNPVFVVSFSCRIIWVSIYTYKRVLRHHELQFAKADAYHLVSCMEDLTFVFHTCTSYTSQHEKRKLFFMASCQIVIEIYVLYNNINKNGAARQTIRQYKSIKLIDNSISIIQLKLLQVFVIY